MNKVNVNSTSSASSRSCEHVSCADAARFVVVSVKAREDVQEHPLCDHHVKPFFQKYWNGNVSFDRHTKEVQLDVELMVFDQLRHEQLLWLRIIDGEGFVGVMTGVCELNCLRYLMKKPKPPRPMTFDVMAMIVEALEGELKDVIIDRWIESERSYHAKIRLTHRGEERLIDARPSDAINIAVACDRPILMKREVLEAVTKQ